MKFVEQNLPGLFLIEAQLLSDERGFFARTFCEEEFAAAGLASSFPQANLSRNIKRGTLRGMHLQHPPGEEAKIVRCVRGRIFDAVVDLRHESPGYGRWFAIELSAENALSLYIPKGLAHGFQTLEDDCDVYYHMSCSYRSGLQGGIHPFDEEVAISWPLEHAVVSPKDLALPKLFDFRVG